jgi:hypothetical protein
MKKLLNIFLASTVIAFASCSKDDDDNSPSGPSAEVATSLKSGTWKVSSYSDNGTDKTIDYNSFVFTFAANGTVSASNGILTANGTWKTQRDGGKHELDIEFTNPALFEPIDEDWEIVSQSATQVSLKDVNDAGTETDLLVLTKN